MWRILCAEANIAVEPKDLCRRKFLIQLKSGCPIARFAFGMLFNKGEWVARDLGRVMDSFETLFTWSPPLKEAFFGKSEYTRKVEEVQKKAGRLWLEIFYFDNVPREINEFKRQGKNRRRFVFSQKPYDMIGPCIQYNTIDGFARVSSQTSAASLKTVATSCNLSSREKAIATIFWAKACAYSVDPDLDRELEAITNDDSFSKVLRDNAQIFLEYRLHERFSRLSLKENTP